MLFLVKRFLKIFFFILIFPAKTLSISISLVNEKHYTIVENYQISNHVREQSIKIKQDIEDLLGNSLDTRAFWSFFFKKDSKGLKIKKGKENRVRLIYIFLDQWRTQLYRGNYKSYFDGIRLTMEDLKQIKTLFSKNEQYIIDSLTSLWSLDHPIHLSRSNLWNLSKIRKSRQKEFEFLWAFLIVENQISSFSSLSQEGSDLNSLFKVSSGALPLFQKARNLIFSLAEEGFAPAQYLEGFMNVILDKNWNSALTRFEQSYYNNYQKDVCSVLLGVLNKKYSHWEKSAYYLQEAVYTHGYELLKGELLDLHFERNDLASAFTIAKEIVENFKDFSPSTFIESMEKLSWLFYFHKGDKKKNYYEEAYIWMEMARIASEDYKNSPLFIPHSHSLERKLPPTQRVQLKLRAKNIYQARKEFLTAVPPSSCTPSLFH